MLFAAFSEVHKYVKIKSFRDSAPEPTGVTINHTGPHCTSAGPYRTGPHRVVGEFIVVGVCL